MASLKETKKRIVSVKNTQKITRAMKLVASAKYARSIRSLVQARPYRQGIADLTLSVLGSGESNNPLMEVREEKNSLLIIIATDRGLCGGLNTNLFKKANGFIKKVQKDQHQCALGLWGRKAVAFGGKQGLPLWQKVEKRQSPLPFEKAEELVDSLCTAFLAHTYDGVYIAYSHFENALTQQATVVKLLPLAPEFLRGRAKSAKSEKGNKSASGDELLEPERALLLPQLLRSFLAAEIFAYFLASVASENAARMTAMDNATNNADEVISKLTLEYNQARQAAITKELIEITSGAEAL